MKKTVPQIERICIYLSSMTQIIAFVLERWYETLGETLWNRWSDFEIISQECSLCDPFQNVFVKLWSINKHGSGEGGFLAYTDMKKFLKNLVLLNHWSEFEIISQKYSLSDLSQKFLVKFWYVMKHSSSEWELFSLYGHEQTPKKFSSLKALVRFWDNFIEMFLGWPFSKIVRKILICQ